MFPLESHPYLHCCCQMLKMNDYHISAMLSLLCTEPKCARTIYNICVKMLIKGQKNLFHKTFTMKLLRCF